MSAPDARSVRDRCPGVFSPHPAADGAVARIRLVGGAIGSEQLHTLADVAASFGDGHLELTARGNLQIRGISDVEGAGAAIAATGLVPSSSHEKARNIEVSPLTGRIGGHVDVRPLATDLDERLRADSALAGLSGRFLFGLDDGRGDIVGGRPDVAAAARRIGTGEVRFDVIVDGEPVGSVPAIDSVAPALLDVAHDLTDIDSSAWRVADLAEQPRRVLLDRVRGRLDPVVGQVPDGPQSDGAVPEGRSSDSPIVGWFDQDDGRVLLGAVVAHGRLPARLGEFLAAIGAPIIITPHREILIGDLGEGVADTVVRVLAPMGLIFDAASPWARITCCVGAPGCARSLAPVRADVTARVESGEPVTAREHWVGCDRGCGSPKRPHIRVEASPGGYRRAPAP
ncbi:precorrin-3B synthase [Gordonia sp. NPDC003429]